MVERAICNRLMELKGFSFDDTFVQIKVVRTFKERELFIETNESFRRLCYSQFKGTIGVGKQMKSHGGNVVSFSLKDVLELNKNVYELLE
ncbi:hypothetical protein HK098_003298 [Nowakowskiella sp. JEL0407]|nr:hypothetical protein HK098_003298 [Nowakowskiella sp. JEL0407]